ncbi:hypothetical protein [Microbacterium maritypicum]|uniref:hypothetical protein n=1 Tax=Microbacterium maritypicum TaxID=33918 RepID=UPI003CF35ADA
MSIETYVAVLHDTDATPVDREPVLCPLQPDRQPKPIIDHEGVLYELLGDQSPGDGVFDYRRTSDPGGE